MSDLEAATQRHPAGNKLSKGNTVNINELITQLLQAQENLDTYKQLVDDLKAQIRAYYGEAGSHTVNGHTVSLSEQRRLDMNAIAQAYPADTHPELYVLMPDTKKVRTAIAPADLEQFNKPLGDLRLSVK